MPLNDTAIKALKPEVKPYKRFDGDGLYLEVLPTGTKTWRIKYRFGGQARSPFTLGHYPAVSLRDARSQLIQVKELIAQGIDPALERKKAAISEDEQSFRAVALDWIEKQRSKWTEEHYNTVKYRLESFAFGHIGNKHVKDITPQDILRFLRPIESQGKNNTAHRVLGVCSLVFRYAIACGHCEINPCASLSQAMQAYVTKPRAALVKPEDVAVLMAAIEDYQGRFVMKMALYWSAYTFCRPKEVRLAEWSEIHWDKAEWRIPAAKMKMRREHRVPLPRQCMAILGKLKEYAMSDHWIFPAVRPSKPISENGVLTALRRMDYGKEEMSAHGFRAMASTLLNELGYRADLIEMQLAHEDANKIRAIYNRAEYLDERRVMMQAWADYLDQLRDSKL